MKKCPLCKGKTDKVIYYGLPVRFCQDEECSCMFGFWDLIVQYLPYNGVTMYYEGPYLLALWYWLTANETGGEER